MRTKTWTRPTANRAPEGFGPEVWGSVRDWVRRARRHLQQARQRRDLSRLSDHNLRDIGLTRADVRGEIERPFWRA